MRSVSLLPSFRDAASSSFTFAAKYQALPWMSFPTVVETLCGATDESCEGVIVSSASGVSTLSYPSATALYVPDTGAVMRVVPPLAALESAVICAFSSSSFAVKSSLPL